MSTKADRAESSSPAPWSPNKPWTPMRNAPGAFPASPSSESHPVGISAPQSLSAAVKARKDEYIRKKTIKVKVGTWNVASVSGTEKDLGAWFVKGLGVKGLSQDLAGLSVESSPDLARDDNVESVNDQEERRVKKKITLPKHDVPAVPHDDEVELYVLGLQEVVDVTSVSHAFKPYTDSDPGKKWKTAMTSALPPGYELIAEQQLLGLLILIYASSELAPTITSVSATSVGTGLMGLMGNKGAVSVRLVLAETTRLCFVNCHLAAGADSTALNRRIWDTTQIQDRTRFAPVAPDGEVVQGSEEKIGDEDFAFWFGDLNYRLDDIPGEDVRRLLLLHTRNEYDVENKSRRRIDSELGYISAPSNESQDTTHYEISDVERPATESSAEPVLDPKDDPASLHTTLQSLLLHDQLHAQQRMGKAFHEGWREGPINFLPTYKYDIGSVGMFDSGEKKRSPSWCDRILYRTKADLARYHARAMREKESRKKDEDMKKRGLDEAAEEQSVLFNYDPDTDGLAYGDDYDEEEDAYNAVELVQTQEGYEDTIELDHYISHQRVLSSDHKPLDATFTLTYDAVIPDLKAKVHQDVARELDKAENEARPAVTVVVDNLPGDAESDTDESIEYSNMNCVRFGEVRYKAKTTRTLTIANTGPIAATFSFADRSLDPQQPVNITPSWLTLGTEIEHTADNGTSDKLPSKEHTLSPGETQSVELILEVSDPQLVYQLNEMQAQLDDVLVLRIMNGRDYFIPVKAKWMSTCFCRTLDELVLAPEGGVRSFPKSPRNRDSTGFSKQHALQNHQSAPKELFLLVEAIPNLVERSVADWEMLHGEETAPWQHDESTNAWPFAPESWTFHAGEDRTLMLESVREALDTAKPIEAQFTPEVPCLVRLEILAETLTSFLQSLRDGIVPSEPWSTINQQLGAASKTKENLNAEEVRSIAMDAISSLPVHNISLSFLVFMLTKIMDEVAPLPSSSSTVPLPRRSRASTLSSEPGSEASATPSEEQGSKKSFFPSLRRRRTQNSTTGSADRETQAKNSQTEKRKAMLSSYARIFGPLVIRSDQDQQAKGKDKKALEDRKMSVLEAFLETSAIGS